MYYIFKNAKSNRVFIAVEGQRVKTDSIIIGCTNSREEAEDIERKEAAYHIEKIESGASIIREKVYKTKGEFQNDKGNSDR